MPDSRLRILVTNDDGIHSAGLTSLAKALSRVGEVWVVAPDRERTAVAHAVTLHKPLRIHQVEKHGSMPSMAPRSIVSIWPC